MDAPLSNTGIVLLAQEIDDNTFFDGDLQQLTIVGNPEAAYEQCTEYITDCNEPLPAAAVNDEGLAGYRGIDEDELLNREGLSPREYLEFTERERVAPPPAGMTLAGSASKNSTLQFLIDTWRLHCFSFTKRSCYFG